MSKITNRLAFFAKIKKRSDDLETYVAKASGKADAGAINVHEDHKPFVEREPYVTERHELEIRRSVDYVNPANQGVVVNQDLKVRAQKVAQGHFTGASSYLVREVITEDHDVRGYALMISGWTGKGTVSRTVDGVVNEGPYGPGTEVQVEFVPADGYRFVSWSDGGNNPHTVTINGDTILSVVAEQIPTYTLAFSAGENGAISATVNGTSVNSGVSVREGSAVVLTATPSQGYGVDSWEGLPEGTAVEGNTRTFNMYAATTVSVSFKIAFQGLKLTNTAVSEYITGLTEDPTAQLQFSEMYDEPGLPYPYYWCNDDYDAYTATRNPGIGDTISGSSVTEVSAGTVTAYVSTPISNVLHFQPDLAAGYQYLKYSTDADTWTDWPVTPGAPTVESTFLAVCASSSTLGYIEDGGLTCEYVYAGPVHGNSIHYRYKWSKRYGSGPDYVYTGVRDPQGYSAFDGTGSSASVVFEVSGGGIIDYATVDSFTVVEGGERYYFDGAVSGVMSGAYGVYKWTSDDGNSLFTDVRNPMSGRDMAYDSEDAYPTIELEPFNSYNAIASFVSYNSETNKSKWSTYDSFGEAIEIEFTGRNPAIDSETSEGVAFHVVKVYYDKGFTANTDLGVMTFNNPHPVNFGTVVVAWSSTTDANQAVIEAALDSGVCDPTVGDAIGIFETVEGGPTGGGEVTSVSKPNIKITLQGIDEEFVLNGRNIRTSWGSTTTEHEVYTNTYWPVVGELCQYWSGEHSENEVATIATVTMSNPDTYGTVTFSNDLYLKGVSDSWCSDNSMSKLWTDGTVNASGRPSSVITGTDQPADFSEVSYALGYIFGDYDEVGQFVRVVDASGLILDDTLGSASYAGMFNMNTTLTTPPVLPATTLTGYCYAWMFGGCENLATAPVLPALTLTESCYQGMFGECPLINDITCLATDITASACTDNWVNDVAASGTFHRNPDTWAGWATGVSGIPSGWGVVPPAPTVTVTFSCSHGSVGATVDGSTIQSPAQVEPGKTVIFTITPDAGYEYTSGPNPESVVVTADETKTYVCDWCGLKFIADNPGQEYTLTYSRGTNVTYSKPIYVSADGGEWSCLNPSQGSSKTTTFTNALYIKGDNATYNSTNGANENQRCKMVITNEDNNTVTASGRIMSLINSTGFKTLESLGGCGANTFLGIFVGSYISSASGLILPSESYNNVVRPFAYLFENCAKLTSMPTIPNLVSDRSYECMFQGCTALTATNTIPHAVVNGQNSADGMFYGCTNLNEVHCAATSVVSGSTDNWLNNVAASGIFYRNETTWAGWTDGPSGIPTSWTVVPPKPNPLKFTAIDGAATVGFWNQNSVGAWDFEYSTDGSTWMTYTVAITEGAATMISIAAGQSVYFRGQKDSTTLSSSNRRRISATGSLSVSGDITSLLNGVGGVVDLTPYGNYTFCGLLGWCASIKSVTDLILPSTTLVPGAYSYLFRGAGITTAPTLPAMSLPSACYANMFDTCASLVTAPGLPATTCAQGCYTRMFMDCSILAGTVNIAATTPGSGSEVICSEMFSGAGTSGGGTIYVGGDVSNWISRASINISKWDVQLGPSEEVSAE